MNKTQSGRKGGKATFKKYGGYGYGGWFGQYVIHTTAQCVHDFIPASEDEEVCRYCESYRIKPLQEKP